MKPNSLAQQVCGMASRSDAALPVLSNIVGRLRDSVRTIKLTDANLLWLVAWGWRWERWRSLAEYEF